MSNNIIRLLLENARETRQLRTPDGLIDVQPLPHPAGLVLYIRIRYGLPRPKEEQREAEASNG